MATHPMLSWTPVQRNVLISLLVYCAQTMGLDMGASYATARCVGINMNMACIRRLSTKISVHLDVCAFSSQAYVSLDMERSVF